VTPELAIRRTRDWLESFVIGLGLCPFARRPFEAGAVGFEVCEASDREGIYRRLLECIDLFWQADAADMQTTLLLVPTGLEDFGDYLDMLASLDAVLDEVGLRGRLQIASFHPDYRFDGAAVDDPANYSNRSPLPLFHLIREDDLARAIETFDDIDAVPKRNVERLRAMGLSRVRRLAAGETR
jgi:hypothetical protein